MLSDMGHRSFSFSWEGALWRLMDTLDSKLPILARGPGDRLSERASAAPWSEPDTWQGTQTLGTGEIWEGKEAFFW
jgi:hypothetical protein